MPGKPWEKYQRNDLPAGSAVPPRPRFPGIPVGDPWAAFPDANTPKPAPKGDRLPQLAGAPTSDPWAAFPDAPSSQQAAGGNVFDRFDPPESDPRATANVFDQFAAPAAAANRRNIRVLAPDGTIVEFPEGTPDDVMAKAMQETFGGPSTPAPPAEGPWTKYAAPAAPVQTAPTEQPINTAADVGLSFASGVPRGVVETAMSPISLNRMGEGIGEWLFDKAEGPVRSFFGMDPAVPGPEHDRVRDAIISPLTGAANYALRKVTGNDNADLRTGIYDAQDRTREIMDAVLHKPETTAGKYAGTIGEFAAPGGLPSKAARLAGTGREMARHITEDLIGNVFGPAVASEGAGQLAEGTPYEGSARFIGALAGNAATAAGRAYNAPESVVRRATSEMTDADWRRALGLQNNTTGVKLTGPEAISQATNGGSALPNILRVVEGSVDGRARTAPFFAARPAQVDAAVGNVLDQIAPQSTKPSTLGPISAENATNVIRGAEKARTEAVDPLYRAAATDKVSDDQVTALFDEIDNAIANDKTGILAGPLGELKSRLTTAPAKPGAPAVRVAQERPNGTIYRTTPAVPATPVKPTIDIENLDRARKYFRDKMDLPQIGQDAITKEQNAVVTNILTKLDDAMMNSSPKFREGKATFADISRNEVEPLTQGPVGRVAAANDTTAAGNALLPQNPLTGSAGEAADATRRLVVEDPATTKGLVRQNLADRYTKATTETQEGVRDFAGAKFHKDVAGNDTRQAILDAVLRELPDKQASLSMPELLDVLQATGRRKPVGSATEFNRTINADLGGAASPVGIATGLARSLGMSWTKAGDVAKRAALRGNLKTLADMFVDPNSVELIRNATNRSGKIAFGEAAARTGAEAGSTLFDPRGERGDIGIPGLLEQGNIDLAHRPVVLNDDGSISTVKSMSFEQDGREILIPTISPSGAKLTPEGAIALYRRTGKHLGIFDNAADANAYAKALHKQQEQMYAD